MGTTAGLAIGSEMSAGIRNVTFKDIVMNGSAYGISMKSDRGRGGFFLQFFSIFILFVGIVQDITFSNITVYNVLRNAISISMNYSGYFHKNIPRTNASATPTFKNITIDNLNAINPENGWYVVGLPESPMQHVSFSNINITNAKNLVAECQNISGTCSNSSVFPYCPPCMSYEIYEINGVVRNCLSFILMYILFLLSCIKF